MRSKIDRDKGSKATGLNPDRVRSALRAVAGRGRVGQSRAEQGRAGQELGRAVVSGLLNDVNDVTTPPMRKLGQRHCVGGRGSEDSRTARMARQESNAATLQVASISTENYMRFVHETFLFDMDSISFQHPSFQTAISVRTRVSSEK
jgi:hypothetical protein